MDWLHVSESCEANNSTGSDKISDILCNLKVCYHLHKSLPSYYFKDHVNIILPSASRSSKWSLSCRFPHWNPLFISLLLYMCHIKNPSYILSCWSDIRILYMLTLVYKYPCLKSMWRYLSFKFTVSTNVWKASWIISASACTVINQLAKPSWLSSFACLPFTCNSGPLLSILFVSCNM
jgi:hypothetical protein